MARIQNPAKRELDQQIARAAWALLFIMTGVILLVPGSSGLDANVPHGTWPLLAGLILLGAQAVRSVNDIPIRTSGIVLGVLALCFGAAEFLGVGLPVFPVLLVLIGLSLVLPSRTGSEAGQSAPATGGG